MSSSEGLDHPILAALRQRFGEAVRAIHAWRGDLTAEVAPERIDVLPGCTFAEPELYHSYRRDGARSGRHLAVIVAR